MFELVGEFDAKKRLREVSTLWHYFIYHSKETPQVSGWRIESTERIVKENMQGLVNEEGKFMIGGIFAEGVLCRYDAAVLSYGCSKQEINLDLGHFEDFEKMVLGKNRMLSVIKKLIINDNILASLNLRGFLNKDGKYRQLYESAWVVPLLEVQEDSMDEKRSWAINLIKA